MGVSVLGSEFTTSGDIEIKHKDASGNQQARAEGTGMWLEDKGAEVTELEQWRPLEERDWLPAAGGHGAAQGVGCLRHRSLPAM